MNPNKKDSMAFSDNGKGSIEINKPIQKANIK